MLCLLVGTNVSEEAELGYKLPKQFSDLLGESSGMPTSGASVASELSSLGGTVQVDEVCLK